MPSPLDNVSLIKETSLLFSSCQQQGFVASHALRLNELEVAVEVYLRLPELAQRVPECE